MTAEDSRILSRAAAPDDAPFERALRPRSFEEYVGQDQAVASLRISVEAAKQRGECVDHVLLYGPPGLGKTTLAGIIANEMGTNLVTTAGPAIERGGDLIGLISNLAEKDVFFIDEIHRLPRIVEELLYPAMEDYAVNFVMEKGLHARSIKHRLAPFTLVGATTRPGMLSAPLRERFGIFHHLDFYSEEELARIVTRSAAILDTKIEPGGAREIARRARPGRRGLARARPAGPPVPAGDHRQLWRRAGGHRGDRGDDQRRGGDDLGDRGTVLAEDRLHRPRAAGPPRDP